MRVKEEKKIGVERERENLGEKTLDNNLVLVCFSSWGLN